MAKKDLTAIANQNPTAKAMFKAFAGRERSREVMDIRRLRYELRDEGIEIVPEDFMASFKALQAAGVGKLIQEKGKPARFRWNRSIQEVGKEALGSETPAFIKAGNHVSSPSTPSQRGEPGSREIVVVLGAGREATVVVPPDFTAEEAETLSEVLHAKARR